MVSLPKLLDHILENGPLRTKYRHPLDKNNFHSTAYGGFTVPWIPKEMSNLYDLDSKGSLVKILRLGDDKYFLFVCNPKISRSTIHFYTFFLGCMTKHKNIITL